MLKKKNTNKVKEQLYSNSFVFTHWEENSKYLREEIIFM